MINSINRDMAELYSHPDNANRFDWFSECFIGAYLLYPHSKNKIMQIVTKFNQQLKQLLTQFEQKAVYRQLERQLHNEL